SPAPPARPSSRAASVGLVCGRSPSTCYLAATTSPASSIAPSPASATTSAPPSPPRATTASIRASPHPGSSPRTAEALRAARAHVRGSDDREVVANASFHRVAPPGWAKSHLRGSTGSFQHEKLPAGDRTRNLEAELRRRLEGKIAVVTGAS